jgi:hypothetical protein
MSHVVGSVFVLLCLIGRESVSVPQGYALEPSNTIPGTHSEQLLSIMQVVTFEEHTSNTI